MTANPIAKKVLERPEILEKDKVWMTKGEWASLLQPHEFECLREGQMGMRNGSKNVQFVPGSVPGGAFCCKGCGLECFAVRDFLPKATAYEGYPCFVKSIPGNVDKRLIHKNNNYTLHCERCDSFLGALRIDGFGKDGGVQNLCVTASFSLVLKVLDTAKEDQLIRVSSQAVVDKNALSPRQRMPVSPSMKRISSSASLRKIGSSGSSRNLGSVGSPRDSLAKRSTNDGIGGLGSPRDQVTKRNTLDSNNASSKADKKGLFSPRRKPK
eukprot:CAMPEP_0182445272 /NCGR_PEP_ID=MMETSP1172-20130603/3452_1 /TAXON_ID=708627 /ORGANISM="Timspurckia oligopyrenoides, Strain CCMP3278" /LENGTH=267 /DNA_ID=CAMNT_0024641007 /DNA_START=172 /DNA_END=975 /DNA_ORIENTATION=+